jgi:hypothetical protein
MIPTIQIEEARFTEVAQRGIEREISDGVRLRHASSRKFSAWFSDR